VVDRIGVGSTLVNRVLHVAAEAPALAGSFATVAPNIGAVFGPLLAGIVTGATGEYRSALWLSTALTATAAITLGASGMRTRRGDSVQAR
jgi:DHA1 family chloramphenicol resistance protein-like MFS transporter